LSAACVQLLVTYLERSGSPTVGASGALFGLLLSFGMLFPNRIIVPLIPPIPMKAKYFVAIFGGIELLLGLETRSSVAHFAHLGGMLGAWLLIRHWRNGRRR
jgi:membrane associated rhomboid family serine protease